MCGIVGYIGNKDAYSILVEGLKKLEYRGYDSSGIALYGDKLNIKKCKGKVSDLERLFKNIIPQKKSNIGIGHTRWATHGVASKINAHPHLSMNKRVVIVHNGIIENYDTIKQMLVSKNYKFNTDTDTEVLANLIEYIMITEQVKIGKAMQIGLKQVSGAYAIVVLDTQNPKELICARLGSPLAIGIGKNEYFIGSDASPFLQYTKKCIYLNDGEFAIISLEKEIVLREVKQDKRITPYVQELTQSVSSIEKGGFDHFMLKEIFEQPSSIINTLRGRLDIENYSIKLSSIESHINKFLSAQRIIFISCGTSWHAALLAEYIFEELIRIPVEVEYASEFKYRNPIIKEGDIVIPISQSGETADTLSAIKLAKQKKAFIYGICNVVGASIPRETDSGAYTHAGVEIGVASTKAFTSQVALLLLIALDLSKRINTISKKTYQSLLKELYDLPEKIKVILKTAKVIEKISEKYLSASNFIYLGRRYNFPIALEGALKLKEISYIHAEAYPAAEMKHGPIALIDKNMPVVIIATKRGNYEKILNNMMEIKSRHGQIIAIVTKGDKQIKSIANHTIEIPECDEIIASILATIPLQLLSYYIAVKKGCNVDQPRNLAKSVTVE